MCSCPSLTFLCFVVAAVIVNASSSQVLNVPNVYEKIGYNESNRTGISQVPRGTKEHVFKGVVSSWLTYGVLVLYFLGALYSFAAIGIICGDYFLPSVDFICSDLNLSQDVAAATFMSFATTSPELFVILFATFLTETDIGLGAVVGSGMFNILGVATVGGLAASTPIKLDWWPLLRDSLVYVIAVGGLVLVLSDGKVTFLESICLIVYYFIYFITMLLNRRLRNNVKWLVKKVSKNKHNKKTASGLESKEIPVQTVSQTLDNDKSKNPKVLTVVSAPEEADEEFEEEREIDNEALFVPYFVHYDENISLRRISLSSRGSNFSERQKSMRSLEERKMSEFYRKTSSRFLRSNENFNGPLSISKLPNKETKTNICETNEIVVKGAEESQSFRTIFFTYPSGSVRTKVSWLALWIISFLFYWTIPDPRTDKGKKFYPVTFVASVAWIGACSYFGTWTISNMGEIFGIPDSIMGLTFLALGGSMPEATSIYIMARQGEGGLGFSNSLGGNTMDICLCLGMPWLAKSITDGSLKIYSEGLVYNAVSLILGIVILVTVGIFTKFNMNRKMGIVCCFFYLIFMAVSVLVELKIIGFDKEETG